VRRSALLLPLLVALAGCSKRAESQPAATTSRDSITLDKNSPHLQFLKIETVQESDAAGTVTFPGRVAFDEDHTQRVSTPVDGRATALLVNAGNAVKVGQPLVRLSSPQVGELQAEAQKAAQDLAIAQKTVDRVHRLLVEGAVSEKEVAQAEADLAKAKSAATQANARLASLNVPASDPGASVSLLAQVAGTVVERNVLVGQEVRADATTPLLTITNLDVVWVLADVYEQDLSLVQAGAAVSVRVPAYPNQAFPGTIAHLGDVVDTNSRTVKLRCVVPNPEGRLKPEMFAKVDLTATGGAKVIFVSSRAVLSDSERPRVIVVTSEDTFQLRPVEVGSEVEGRMRILSGLKPNEKVVTDGALFLKNEIEGS
jgi:cobalt-zinc-cadmium efflux system membrane fusion protein